MNRMITWICTVLDFMEFGLHRAAHNLQKIENHLVERRNNA